MVERSQFRRLYRKVFARLIRSKVFARLVRMIPGAPGFVNRRIIRNLVESAPGRPYPYSCWSPAPDRPLPDAPYVSWTGLVDRSFTTRHLAPACTADMQDLPEWGEVRRLFTRDPFRRSERSSVLFAFFAQWFTEGFLRTRPDDPRRNTSNHEIDLSQIYGLTPGTTAILREPDGARRGELRSEIDDEGTEWLPRLYDNGGQVRPEFANLPYLQPGPGNILDFLKRLNLPPQEEERRRRGLLATGLETGNGTILHTAFNTVFLRQHNRVCRALRAANPGWDGDRLFETTRAVNTVIILRMLVNEYINHIAGLPLPLRFDNSFAEACRWYRTNRVSLEFNLLYRWHSMVPEWLVLPDERTIGWKEFSFNNALLRRYGPESLLRVVSRQWAGRLGLRNTPDFLMQVEERSFELGRRMRVQPYCAYREAFGLDPITSFAELTGDAELAGMLEDIYGTVERVDFQVGLLAEDKYPPAILGALMLAMVGSEAFSHILTNPLLALAIYDEAIPPCCVELVKEVTSLERLVCLNARGVDNDRQIDPESIRARFGTQEPALVPVPAVEPVRERVPVRA